MAEFSDLKGKTLLSVDVNGVDSIKFTCVSGEVYVMFHDQDCCESVEIEDICGDIEDLIGSEILLAEEVVQEGPFDSYGTSTWTFYKLATRKGYVDIRWYGESNGYYSESVDFRLEEPKPPIY